MKQEKSKMDIMWNQEICLSLLKALKPFPSHRDEVDTIDFYLEEARLQSFRNWPVPYMDPAKLAVSGFYYTGEEDIVRCFECRVEVGQWVEGDDPMVDHQRWSGHCKFIRGLPCGNVPIGVNPNTIPTSQPRSNDVCGNGEAGNTLSTTSESTTQMQFPSTAKLGSLGIGIRRSKGPVHPEYATCSARLKTFENWPKSMSQTKEQLADAGFYYTGTGDRTSCYYCGGGLKDWEPGDDPWGQHATWFSKCYYLLTVKGQDYINNITGQHITPPSREEVMNMSLPSCIKRQSENTQTTVKLDEKSSGVTEEIQSERSLEPLSVAGSCCSETYSESVSSDSSFEDLKLSETKPQDDARSCKICYDGELGVVFLPCGHMVACLKCAFGMSSCPVCTKPVMMTVRAYFS